MEAPTTATASWANDPSRKPLIVYILGAPGAGKGTLCKRLANSSANIYHLSVGDHLRDLHAAKKRGNLPEGALGTIDPDYFDSLMQNQTLFPANDIVHITSFAISQMAAASSANAVQKPIILVDGFPRTIESAELADEAWGKPRKVLFFDCARKTAEERFLKRQRSEGDTRERFNQRYDKFEKNNTEIVAHYEDLVIKVGTEKDTDETWKAMQEDVVESLEKLGKIETES